ncbi:MAG: hypothetical protein ACLRSW_11650 [Christensenellaceae bacterium]
MANLLAFSSGYIADLVCAAILIIRRGLKRLCQKFFGLVSTLMTDPGLRLSFHRFSGSTPRCMTEFFSGKFETLSLKKGFDTDIRHGHKRRSKANLPGYQDVLAKSWAR